MDANEITDLQHCFEWVNHENTKNSSIQRSHLMVSNEIYRVYWILIEQRRKWIGTETLSGQGTNKQSEHNMIDDSKHKSMFLYGF